MKKYIVRVKHDDGIINIMTYATNEDKAAYQVKLFEGCPLSAIQEVKEL